MEAILNINKPAGMTSYDVVAAVKRLSREKRVGHAGTLDPDATGVLPVCLGRATRIIEFLTGSTKSYRAVIELGTVTDTYDAGGKVIQTGDSSGISREQFQMALASFLGTIAQTPPMYSALKHHGEPLYKLARAGITVTRESRPVQIYQIQLIDWQPPRATIEVECGKGTYIRSLAHDIGQHLGCGAHMKSLVRLRCGIFNLDDAITLADLAEAFRYGYWEHFAYPTDTVLHDLPVMILSEATAQAVRQGNAVPPRQNTTPQPEDVCRAYTIEGDFLAVLRFNGETRLWQPKKVFPAGSQA
ncbi:MAG: tRNA pseudouridine(55) synthase TruB [Dehalococcoidales bacterium]|nr:tRNA pseudouridine(55) synthase TruB [Dehalococcoidales bacterium]